MEDVRAVHLLFRRCSGDGAIIQDDDVVAEFVAGSRRGVDAHRRGSAREQEMSNATRRQEFVQGRIHERVESSSAGKRRDVVRKRFERTDDAATLRALYKEAVLLDGREDAHFLGDLGMSLTEEDRKIDDARFGVLQCIDEGHGVIHDFIDAFWFLDRAPEDALGTKVVVLHSDEKQGCVLQLAHIPYTSIFENS